MIKLVIFKYCSINTWPDTVKIIPVFLSITEKCYSIQSPMSNKFLYGYGWEAVLSLSMCFFFFFLCKYYILNICQSIVSYFYFELLYFLFLLCPFELTVIKYFQNKIKIYDKPLFIINSILILKKYLFQLESWTNHVVKKC